LIFLIPDTPVSGGSEQNQGRKAWKVEEQKCLRYEKGRRNIKEPKQRKLKPKIEVIKTGCSSLGFWMI
jgi:hypothetical protein